MVRRFVVEGDQQQRHAARAGPGNRLHGSLLLRAHPSLIENVVDPITREMYDRDPRFIAQKAEKYLQSTKIGDTSWGPEAEFFIFDHARYDQTNHSAYYHIDSDEGVWNMGRRASTWAARSGTRKAISLLRRRIRNRTSARK